MLEHSSAEHIGRLRSTYSGRLAGIYIEHRPDFRIVLRLTGADPVQLASVGSGSDAVPVEVVTGAPSSLAQLQNAVIGNLAALNELFPSMFGATADERTGEIRIDAIAATPIAAAAVQAKAEAARRLLGAPVRIRAVNGTVDRQAVRGSGNLQYNCTAGFVVQNGTRKGPLTAAHCLSSYDYYDLADGTAYTISGPSTAARNDASHDVRWLDATADAVPQFYADTATPRVLTGRRTQSNTAVGSTVCHRGISSNYSCGSVESIAYTPTKPATATSPEPYYCGSSSNITCANTWVQVGGSSLRCARGDSGGPWFSSTIALGIHSGGAVDGSGNCISAWYMSTDRISTGLGSTYSLIYG